MAKIVSDQTAIWLTTGAAAPASAAVTSISNADPTVIVMATLPTGLADLDFVLIEDSGTLLDGKYWQVSSVGTPANSFTLADADLSDEGAPVTVGNVTAYNLAGASPEFLKACETTITLNGQDPDSVDLSDMCEAMTRLGDPKPPTVSFTGFVDSEDEGFTNMIVASLESPKLDRLMMILYPDGEYVVGPAEVGAISVSAARGQGLQYSGTATYTEVPTYSWAL